MKRRWLVCSVVLLSLVLALPASTQTKDVLTNGGFEIDLSGWAAWAGPLTRTTTTTHGGSAGAAQQTSSGTAAQCVDISGELADWPEDGGVKYATLSGYMLSEASTFARLRITFFSDTACSNFVDGVSGSQTNSTEWTLHTVTAAIPATAQSVGAMFQNLGGGGSVYTDDLTAFSSTVTAVQARGMAARNSLWAVGLVGVAAVGVVLTRRRRA